MKTKKSQEEIVGFLVIILIVAVAAVVFLGISLRKSPEMKTSSEISDFLYSSFLYSVDCDNYQIKNFKDLIWSCYRNEFCNEEKSCDKAKNLAQELIENSLRVGSDSKYKSYTFKIFSNDNTLIYITSGNSSRNSEGSNIKIITSPQEAVNVSLKLYY